LSATASRLIPRRGLDCSDESGDDADLSGTSLREKMKKTWGLGGMIGTPPVRAVEREDWPTGSAERMRMRDFYANEGWLPVQSLGMRPCGVD
jgi:hypothetical protein